MSSKKDDINSNTSIDKIIDNTFNQLKNIIDANTVVGSTIKISDSLCVIPISKVSVGLISGGGEEPKKKNPKSVVGAGSSTGFTISPIGFITISNGLINFLSAVTVENSSSKLIESMLNMSEKFISKMEGGNHENK